MNETNGRAGVGPRTHLCLLALILGVAAVLRLHGIDEQGVRFVDEGEYCFFGLALHDGVPGQIIDKPGHALLVALSYWIFGVDMASPLRLSALMGVVAVLAVYSMGRQLYGRGAGLVAAAAVACMPLCLFYQRSAMSDGNYLCLSCLAMALSLRSMRARGWRRFAACAAAGAIFGFSFSVNPSTILFAGCTGVGLLLQHRLRAVLPGAAMLAAAAGVWAIVNWAMGPYMRWEDVAGLYRFHARWVLAFQPSWWFLRNTWRYAGPAVVLLGMAGAAVAIRRRSQGDLFALALLIGLLLFSVRMSIRFPRVYMPLAVPLALLAGRLVHVGAAYTRRWPGGAALALCIIVAVPNVAECQRFIRLRSGYDAACRVLAADGVRNGLTTHSWWTFQTFTRRRFRFAGDAVARKLRQGAPALVDEFKRMAASGSTHLVIDYLFWLNMDPEVSAGLERLLCDRPPTFTIANPIVSHEATALEDGKLPALERRPFSHHIYIYRLRDYLPK